MSIADEFGGAVEVMTEEDLEGLRLADIECRSCSGYGNCGYKTYHLYKEDPDDDDDEAEVVSICNRRKRKYECIRDGIPYEE